MPTGRVSPERSALTGSRLTSGTSAAAALRASLEMVESAPNSPEQVLAVCSNFQKGRERV